MEQITLDNVISHDDFIFALCIFIDEFKRNTDRHKMIEAPPQLLSSDNLNLCILAGATHKLANEYGIAVPEWVYDGAYIMSYPYFAYDTENKEYQDFLLEDTPFEFASKNLFLGSNAFERV